MASASVNIPSRSVVSHVLVAPNFGTLVKIAIALRL